jgi:hypothetical protein
MAADLLIKALRVIWTALQAMDIPVSVMGGLAMSLWKYPRATRDVDLLVGVNVQQANGLLEKLKPLGMRTKHSPPIISVGQLNIIQLLYEQPEAFLDVQIDLLLAEQPYQLAALKRSAPASLPDLDIKVAVLTCEDLILHKMLAGRIIDMADVANLLKQNISSLDLDYLTGWIKNQNLSTEFKSIWREAMPDEPLLID